MHGGLLLVNRHMGRFPRRTVR